MSKSYYKPVSYEKVCAYCGKEFTAHDKRKIYCSRKCRDVAIRLRKGIKCNPNTEPYHKVCKVCGKPFDTYRDATVTCSSECSKAWRNRNRKGRDKRYERTWDEYIADVKAEAELRKERKKLVKYFAAIAALKTDRVCKNCGEIFHSQYKNQVFCSKECARQFRNRRKDRRINRASIIDTDITLPRLFKRDSGICWICGTACNYNDKKISKSGHEFPGDTYPTIDHVIPISRGGTESWDNVRLACWKCNLEKSDKIYPFLPLEKEFAYSCKARGNAAKKTAQYTLDGNLIKIWPSTGQIERTLGLKSKTIQNVCRGDKSTTGNAYGYHWEYVEDAQ